MYTDQLTDTHAIVLAGDLNRIPACCQLEFLLCTQELLSRGRCLVSFHIIPRSRPACRHQPIAEYESYGQRILWARQWKLSLMGSAAYDVQQNCTTYQSRYIGTKMILINSKLNACNLTYLHNCYILSCTYTLHIY